MRKMGGDKYDKWGLETERETLTLPFEKRSAGGARYGAVPSIA